MRLLKLAALNPGLLSKAIGGAKAVGKGAVDIGKGIARGAASSGGQTIGDTLKLKGLAHAKKGIEDAAKAGGLKTSKGRQAFAAGLGKAAPSLATAAGYGAIARKAYNKTLGTEASNPNYAYYQDSAIY